MTKSDKAILLFKNGHVKEALAIFKTFHIGFTKDEKRTIEIASDCLNGRSSFYTQLGIDAITYLTEVK